MAFRQSHVAVSATIGTVLMVAITVLLAGVVYLFVSGSLGPAPPPPPSIAFDSGGWSDGNYSAAIVTAVGVSDVGADALTFIVRDTDQVAYCVCHAGEPITTSTITVTVFYIDHDNNNRITGGDSMLITVDPPSASSILDGGTFELHNSNRQLALHGL